METISFLLTSNARREVRNGRRYLVADCSMIVPGVLNGSQGALYYPPEEVRKNPGVWNGVALTYGHPFDKFGENTSVKAPGIEKQFRIGYVYNDRFEKGKRKAEAWFDEELTRNKDPELYKLVSTGQQVELSTGLFTDNERVENGKAPDGRPYDAIARNYKPDHLAVLPNQKGACSLQDGCGINVNCSCGGKCGKCKKHLNNSEHIVDKKTLLTKIANLFGFTVNTVAKVDNVDPSADYDSPGKKPAKEDVQNDDGDDAEPDGDEDDVTDNCDGASGPCTGSSASSDDENRAAAKDHLSQGVKAKAAGNNDLAKLHFKAADAHHDATKDRGTPFKKDARAASKAVDSYMTKNPTQQGEPMTATRNQLVQWLTTNCACHKGKEKVLANEDNYTEAELRTLKANAEQLKKLTANASTDNPDEEIDETDDNSPNMQKDDEPARKGTDGIKGQKMADSKKPSSNAAATLEDFEASMPPAAMAIWNAAKQVETGERQRLVGIITANVADPARKKVLVNKLMDRNRTTMEDLRDFASAIPQRQVQNHAAPAPNYMGMFGGTQPQPVDNSQNDDSLDLPTINYAEVAASQRTHK